MIIIIICWHGPRSRLFTCTVSVFKSVFNHILTIFHRLYLSRTFAGAVYWLLSIQVRYLFGFTGLFRIFSSAYLVFIVNRNKLQAIYSLHVARRHAGFFPTSSTADQWLYMCKRLCCGRCERLHVACQQTHRIIVRPGRCHKTPTSLVECAAPVTPFAKST